MKVVDLIKKLEELGYNEKTEICFGLYDCAGEWYDFKVEEIEDGDREVDVDNIGVNLKLDEAYSRAIIQGANVELEEDLRLLIQKYC